MLKRPITYEDFNGETITDIYYFHLSKPELLKLQVGNSGGLNALIQRIIETKDGEAIISEFEKLVLMSYGEKSDDGKRFIKSDEKREEFSQTAAYQTLFMEIATDDTKAVEFLKGILPADMQDEIEKAEMKIPDQPTGPPKPPGAAA